MILHLSYCRMLRSWLSAEIGLLLCAILFLSSASGLAAKPNILMILADDLGYGDLSSYGATDLQSPNIDGLVKSGLRMDNFYANCPVCSPTRASLLTGRHPELVGVPGVVRTDPQDNWGFLDPAAIMLPQMLKKAGYHVDRYNVGIKALGSSPVKTDKRGEGQREIEVSFGSVKFVPGYYLVADNNGVIVSPKDIGAFRRIVD